VSFVQSRGLRGFKNGFAPPGALLAALWGDKPRRKAPASLVFGSGAYVHRSTVGDL